MKKVPILQVGWPAPAPPTPPVIRVVLFHTEAAVKDLDMPRYAYMHFKQKMRNTAIIMNLFLTPNEF